MLPKAQENARMRLALLSCKTHFVAAAGFSAAVNLLYIAPTLYMLQVYDRVVPTRGLHTLLFLTILLLLSLLTLALLDRTRTRLLVRAGVAIDAIVTPALLDATLGRPDTPAARAAMRDFDGLRAAVSGPATIALFDAPWMPVYIIVCFLVHPAIGAVGLVAIGILTAIAFVTERATRGRLDQAQALAVRAYAEQEAVLAAAEAVRALGMRRALVIRGRRRRAAMLSLQTGAGFRAGDYLTLTKFVRLAVQSLALGLGAWLAADGLISGGAIFASSFLMARALAPIEQLVAGWRTLAKASNAYRSLNKVLSVAANHGPLTLLPAPQGGVRLENVTVLNEAHGRAALESVTASIRPGEVVAVIGPSGAGKSTLVRAIVGAIPLAQGCVRIDEADLVNWEPELIAQYIGYLPQEPSLIEGTVAENICRFATELKGNQEEIDQSVVAAAEAVGALSLILHLPGGFNHRLAIGGRGLSAGQAQRIALARAVFCRPSLVVLDEPNAHLDGEGDAALNEVIAKLKADNTTVIVVSHKVGVLAEVDRVMLVRNGKVELFGPRDEVLGRLASANIARMTPHASKPAMASRS